MARRVSLLILVFFALALPAGAQLREIDSSRLPPDEAVQTAYRSLLPIEQFARTYNRTANGGWPYSTPKAQVVSTFEKALDTLESAHARFAGNSELTLLTGLVAHLAYNVDIEPAYEKAMGLLTPLASSAGDDPRPLWFLGMQRCQSNDTLGGAEELLRVEAGHRDLPEDFWRDEASCDTAASLPFHAVHALDSADKLGTTPERDAAIDQAIRARVKTSTTDATYSSKDVWQAEKTDKRVRFTNSVCGLAFEADPNAPMDLRDVAKGSCVAVIKTPAYPAPHGPTTGTILILAQSARGESFEAYADRMLKSQKNAKSKLVSDLPCPVKRCVEYEIVNPAMYPDGGGAHLLAVLFAAEEPETPGLRFEHPHALPKGGSSPEFYRPNDVIQRLPGTIYYFVTADGNEDIYSNTRAEFIATMKSLEIDAK